MSKSSGFPTPTPPPLAAIPVESLIREQTGTPITERAFQRQKERFKATRDRLEMLERAANEGDATVVNGIMKDTISLVGFLSGESFEAVRFPRRVFHAGAAERSRKDTLRAFAYFLLQNPGCRHVIVTCGAPVDLEAVPGTLRKSCDRIRRLRSCDWFRSFGEVLMRSAEFSITGGKYHCHIHLVVRPCGQAIDDDWVEVANKLQSMFGSVVLDDKNITDEYGAAQYLFDGNDLLNIDLSDLTRLQELMKHFRTHEPQGSFRAFCRELRSTKKKITWVGTKLVPVLRNDGSFQGASGSKSIEEDHSRSNQTPIAAKADPRCPNRLLRITAPFAHAKRVREPHLMILNYDGDFKGYLSRNPQFAKFRDELMPQWLAGLKAVGAEPPNVHCTVQVTDHGGSPASEEEAQQDAAAGDDVVLIEDADWQMAGLDPADFLWRPIPRPRPQGFRADEDSFPI